MITVLKPLRWVGSSKKDLVYTVRYAQAIYVLHCFQKKSPKGIVTAKHDVDLIKSRLKAVEENIGE